MFIPNKNKESYEGFDNIFLNKKENAIHEKNIENLVHEIKEAEKKMKKEMNEIIVKKKIIPRISMPKIKLTPINIQTIQYILSNKTKNQNMLIVLNALLSNMKFVSIAKDEHDKEKLVSSLSSCLKLEKKPKGSLLFRYGNKGSRLYIVLGGEISVLILKEVIVELTFLNYLKYLLYLKLIKEDELVKKILATNQMGSIQLTEKYLDRYYENIIAFINKYYIKVSVNEYEVKRYTSLKKVEQIGSVIKNLLRQNTRIPQGKNKFNIKEINNQFKINIKNIKSFKRQTTIDESRLSSFIFHKNNILSIDNKEEEIEKGKQEEKMKEKEEKIKEEKDEKDEEMEGENKEKDSISDNSEKDSKNINKINFNDKKLNYEKNENNPKIKYIPSAKNPNYLELDVASLGPHDIVNLVNYVIHCLETLSQKTNKFYSPSEYIKLCSLDQNLKISDKNIKKEKLTVFQYFEITKKVEGDIFGEITLQHDDNKRTATMIVTKDSVFGCLSRSDYNLCLRGIEMRKRKTDINFIISFSFFDEQNWVYFDKLYFNYFKKEYLTNGHVLVNQNEWIKNIYFIMEGQFEISTKLSYDDLKQIIKKKNKRIISEQNDKEKEERNKSDNENIGISDEEINKNNSNEQRDIRSYSKKSDDHLNKKKFLLLSKKQMKQMKEIKTYRLSVIDNKDIIGLNDICNEDKISFIKATCISADAIVFSININILEQLRKKSWKFENNYQLISQRREKIMIERLKLVTNQIITNIKQNKIDGIPNLKKSDIKNINIKKRIISAFKTHYSEKMSLEYENTINNYNNETAQKNLIKRKTDKILKLLRKKSNQKIYYKNQNISNKHNNKIAITETNLNSIQNKHKRKTGFTKFMESVTERVDQIVNHQVIIPKFCGLFSPIYNKKSRLDSGKKERRKIIIKLKESELNKKLFPPEKNNININNNSETFKIKDNVENLNKANNFDNLFINKEENQILSNKYLNKILKNEDLDKNLLFSNSRKKTYNLKAFSYDMAQNIEKEYKEYIKRILGTRYKEYEISKGQKTFTNMIMTHIKTMPNSRNYQNKIIQFKTFEKKKDEKIKPIKVDLLFYDQLTKENKANYLKDIILERQIKQRILSRNVKKLYRTINIDKSNT